MKTRKLFVAAVLGLGLMTACTNDDAPQQVIDDNNGEQTLTQLALTVATEASTRAFGEDDKTGGAAYGEENEYQIGANGLMVVFANEAGIAQQIFTPTLKDPSVDDNNTKKAIRVTEPFKVTPGDYYVYVIANYNSGAISPVIAGQTDMKQVFNILDPAKLSVPGSFLMCNEEAPVKTTIATEKATNNEINDAGETEATDPEKVQLISVSIERVVAKVTFNQDTKAFDVMDLNDPDVEIADATIDGVGIINLNNKMYLVKDDQMATNKPVVGDWVYPMDPNYSTVLDGSNDSYVTANFTQPSVPTGGWKTDFATGKFYCPENTMAAAAQQNGQTTGVVYRVKFVLNNAGYQDLNKDGGANYSDKFKAVLALSAKDATITEDIFTKIPEDANGTFYTYGPSMFVSKNAACLYKAIAEDVSAADAQAAAINTAYKALIAKDAAALETDNIKEYTNGYAYYPVWIKHNPSSEVAMEQDKYGVVRNHWYELSVTGISGLGNNKESYENPEDPDDPAEVNIQVQATIKQWTIVKQDVVLQ